MDSLPLDPFAPPPTDPLEAIALKNLRLRSWETTRDTLLSNAKIQEWEDRQDRQRAKTVLFTVAVALLVLVIVILIIQNHRGVL